MIKLKGMPIIDIKIVFNDSRKEIITQTGSMGHIVDLIRRYNREGVCAKFYYKKVSNWLLFADYE